MATGKLVVCVPARNEAARLPILLKALALQTVDKVTIIVALNNTSDSSDDVIRAAQLRHPKIKLIGDKTTFPQAVAHAGSARRRAMDLAVDIAGADGFILTTDADTRPPADWIANNLKAITQGIEIIGGRIVIDEREPLSRSVATWRHLADRYWQHVRHIEDTIDPVLWDLPPRHGDHSGASLCVKVEAYLRSGGLPELRSGEDRALVRNVGRQGGRLAHPIGVWTRVSARTIGRAAGGMADHLLSVEDRCARGTEILLPSFAQWRNRAIWRQNIRRRGGSSLVAELEDSLPLMTEDMVLCPAVFESVS